MKIVVIADIHGNLSSLKKLQEQIDYIEADKVICLGDIIVDYSRPNECIEWVKKNAISVKGNNDAYIASHIPVRGLSSFSKRKIAQISFMQTQVSKENKDYINNLEKSIVLEIYGKKFYFCHYYWDCDDDCIVDGGKDTLEDRVKLFKDVDADYCIFGHEHHFSHLYNDKTHYICVPTLGLRNPSRYVVLNITEDEVNITVKSYLHDLDIEDALEYKLIKNNENFFIK